LAARALVAKEMQRQGLQVLSCEKEQKKIDEQHYVVAKAKEG